MCAAFHPKLGAPSKLVNVSRGLITFPSRQLVRCGHPALHREPLVAVPDPLDNLRQLHGGMRCAVDAQLVSAEADVALVEISPVDRVPNVTLP
jgi:hypothetical protein